MHVNLGLKNTISAFFLGFTLFVAGCNGGNKYPSSVVEEHRFDSSKVAAPVGMITKYKGEKHYKEIHADPDVPDKDTVLGSFETTIVKDISDTNLIRINGKAFVYEYSDSLVMTFLEQKQVNHDRAHIFKRTDSIEWEETIQFTVHETKCYYYTGRKVYPKAQNKE